MRYSDEVFGFVVNRGGCEYFNGKIVANIYAYATTLHPLSICAVEIITIEAKVGIIHVRV